MASSHYPPTAVVSNHNNAQSPGVAAVPDSYFTESRKGEVNELRQLLRNFATERDPMKKRDYIKKVIAYMTLGIDVSRLFTEMMLAIETRDLVIKKMVYLFLCNYATTHPELAQMCTNTLQKDCGNDDPMVRGLALRALCSLRLPQMVEYISEPLRKSLTDSHGYVRKTGVMGILKLYDLDQDAFERCNFVDILYDMLRDPDASVVSNCILVLNELMAKSPNGGMAINRAIMLHLLNRIHEFSEFGILQVLDLVPRYIPANVEEGYQIMNLLDPVLRTSNSGAVLATIRAFLSLTDHLDESADEMKRKVALRIKAPLITLVAAGSSELVYCLLKHVEALVDMCPGIFDDEYRQFYVRYHEPSHIKYVKIDLLPKVTNPDNAPDIVAELAEIVSDVNVDLSRLAVRSMSRIACRHVGGPGCAESIARRLLEMLDLNIDHVCSEAATALADVLRKHPALRTTVAPPLPRTLRYTTEDLGRASVIFLLGECGDIVKEAPYALERLIDDYDSMTDAHVKTTLLTSTIKLFFKRPPEVQKMLGRLLSKATEDVSSQDMHDRALFYYRLFKTGTDIPTLEKLVTSDGVTVDSLFAEEVDEEARKRLMQEFNTLSILYHKTAENFISEEYQVKYVKMPPEHPLHPGAASAPPPNNDATNAVEQATHQMGQTSLADSATPAAAPAPAPAEPAVVDLLGFGDDEPSAAATMTTAAAPAAPPSPAPVSAPGTLVLKASAEMTGDEYQSKWGGVPEKDAVVNTIGLTRVPASTGEVETALLAKGVHTMASGEMPDEFKFFLYAVEEHTGNIFLLQSNVSKTPSDIAAILTIKAVNGGTIAQIDQLVELVKSGLSAYV